jgi:hypothetical protein
MTNNPTAQYYFSGVGFTMLDLDVRDYPNVSLGSITNQSLTQSLRDISFNNATGTISFAVAESPERVRNIVFTGSAIPDGSGFAIGFTGTWEGERVLVFGPENEEPALPGTPPVRGLTVQGYWSAALANQIQ